jgi:hypothetical protein
MIVRSAEVSVCLKGRSIAAVPGGSSIPRPRLLDPIAPGQNELRHTPMYLSTARTVRPGALGRDTKQPRASSLAAPLARSGRRLYD